MLQQLLSALLLASSAAAFAQTAPPVDPKAQLQQALTAVKEADEGKHRFTYHVINNYTTYDAKGHPLRHVIRDYDVTWLNDKPYYKLIALNGHVLTGRDQRIEEERYLNAVATRTKLDMEAQVKAHGGHLLDDGIYILDLLNPTTEIHYLRTENSPVGPVDVLFAKPTPRPAGTDMNPCQWQYTLWIARTPLALLHFRADAPNDPIELCHTNYSEEWFKQIEDHPYAYHREAHVHYIRQNGVVIFNSEDSMTDFRHFQASADDTAPVATPTPDDSPTKPEGATPQ